MAVETSRPTLRRASRRLAEGLIRSSVKKSIVPMTRPPSMIGKQTPDFNPLRLATGAREQVLHLAQIGHEDQVSRSARPDR